MNSSLKFSSKSAFVFLVCALGLGACYDTNSNSKDRQIFGRKSGAGGAYTVIADKCLACHPTFDKSNDSDWISSGYVQAGNPGSSLLFCYIQGNGLCGPGTMPKTGSISGDEIDTLRTWILNMSVTASVNSEAAIETPENIPSVTESTLSNSY